MKKTICISIVLLFITFFCRAQKFQISLSGGANTILSHSTQGYHLNTGKSQSNFGSLAGLTLSYVPGKVKISADGYVMSIGQKYGFGLGEHAYVPSLRFDYLINIRNSKLEIGVLGGIMNTNYTYHVYRSSSYQITYNYTNKSYLTGLHLAYYRPITKHIFGVANVMVWRLTVSQTMEAAFSAGGPSKLRGDFITPIGMATVGVGYEIGKLKRRVRYDKVSNVADEISKLDDLRARGVITEEEFQKRKQYLLEHP